MMNRFYLKRGLVVTPRKRIYNLFEKLQKISEALLIKFANIIGCFKLKFNFWVGKRDIWHIHEFYCCSPLFLRFIGKLFLKLWRRCPGEDEHRFGLVLRMGILWL